MYGRYFSLTWFVLLVVSFTLLSSRAEASGPQDLFNELQGKVSNGDYGEIHSLLIWHDGGFLTHEYYHGYSATRLHYLHSVTKSVTSALMGIAIESGAIGSLDERLLDFFPEYTPANLNEWKEAITLGDMLKMQAGFEWDESSTSYLSPENSHYQMRHTERDWVEYILDQEMSAEPGSEFAYNSGVSILLSEVIARSVGKSTADFAREMLFAGLGIGDFRWGETPQGVTNGGGGLWLRPLDMLKFGRLYLNEGSYQKPRDPQGAQVISSAWIEDSIQPYLTDDTPGRDPRSPFNYGYQWWLLSENAELLAGLAEDDSYFAGGYAGQFIIVVPHLDLVVVSTAQNPETSEIFFSALTDYAYPATQHLVADVQNDGDVDGADFLAWQRGDSLNALGNSDLIYWANNFGNSPAVNPANAAVPEPSTFFLLAIVLAAMLYRRRLKLPTSAHQS